MSLLQFLLWLYYTLIGKEAKRLHLHVHRHARFRTVGVEANGGPIISMTVLRMSDMAKIGDTFTATIAPTNAAGKPAPVFNTSFSEASDSYDVVSIAADGLSAVLVAVAAGTGLSVDVSALSKAGLKLTASAALPDVEVPVDEEAVALNLSVA